MSKSKEEKDNIDRESEFLFNNLKRFSKDIEGFPLDAASFAKLPTEKMSDFADAAIIVMDKAIEKSESPEKFRERANIVKTIKKDLVVKKLKKDVIQGTKLVKLAYKNTNIDEKGLKIKNAATKKLEEATVRLVKFNEQSQAPSPIIAPQHSDPKNKENINPEKNQQKKKIKSPVKFIKSLVNTMRGISSSQQGASTQQTNGTKVKGKTSGKKIVRN